MQDSLYKILQAYDIETEEANECLEENDLYYSSNIRRYGDDEECYSLY